MSGVVKEHSEKHGQLKAQSDKHRDDQVSKPNGGDAEVRARRRTDKDKWDAAHGRDGGRKN